MKLNCDSPMPDLLLLLSVLPLAANAIFTAVTYVSAQSTAINSVSEDVSVTNSDWCCLFFQGCNGFMQVLLPYNYLMTYRDCSLDD